MIRGGSRAAATSKMECFVIIVNGLKCFVIIVNGLKPLTIITKHSILDLAAILDPSLLIETKICYVAKIRILVHEKRIFKITSVRTAEHFSSRCFCFWIDLLKYF